MGNGEALATRGRIQRDSVSGGPQAVPRSHQMLRMRRLWSPPPLYSLPARLPPHLRQLRLPHEHRLAVSTLLGSHREGAEDAGG